MKLSNLAAIVAAGLALSACSWFGGSKTEEYKGAAQRVAKPLEVPPELSAPGMDDRYSIPDPREQTTYSSYAQRTASPQAAGTGGPEVLPKVQGARMERGGDQ